MIQVTIKNSDCKWSWYHLLYRLPVSIAFYETVRVGRRFYTKVTLFGHVMGIYE